MNDKLYGVFWASYEGGSVKTKTETRFVSACKTRFYSLEGSKKFGHSACGPTRLNSEKNSGRNLILILNLFFNFQKEIIEKIYLFIVFM